MFTLERVTDPDIEPVTLAEMKRQLRTYASDTSEDDDITALIVAGREWAEDYTGRALIDQTWRLTIDRSLNPFLPNDELNRTPRKYGYYNGYFVVMPNGDIYLRKSPVLAVISVISVDSLGTETTFDASAYELREADSKWPKLVLLNGGSWGNATLKITFRAGYADRLGSPQQDASVVPTRFKQAIRLWGEALYDRDPTSMPLLQETAQNMLKAERVELQIA